MFTLLQGLLAAYRKCIYSFCKLCWQHAENIFTLFVSYVGSILKIDLLFLYVMLGAYRNLFTLFCKVRVCWQIKGNIFSLFC